MHFKKLMLVACLELILAAPPPDPTSTPNSRGGANYLSGLAVCGTLGFTSEPGDNDLGVFPPPPISLCSCLEACRHNETCKAVSYAAKYEECSFYSRSMEFDQLERDDSSAFAHYDKGCRLQKRWMGWLLG